MSASVVPLTQVSQSKPETLRLAARLNPMIREPSLIVVCGIAVDFGVADLAIEIGREGREGKPIGTMFVVGDTRKVLTMCRPMNFNPFRGYSQEERDIRDRNVREQIKDIAQLEGAIIIRRDGVAVAACMRIDAPDKGFTLSMGLGTRHAAAAAISKSTKAIAVTVSQSSGTVRLFQNGEVMLHIPPLARPLIWREFRMEAQEVNGAIWASAFRAASAEKGEPS